MLTFSLAEHGIEGLKAEIHEVNQADRSRFPLDMELSNAGLLKWLLSHDKHRIRISDSEISLDFLRVR